MQTIDRELAGKRVVVTGANGFVGRATCLRLLASGARVVACVRRTDALADLPAGTERAHVPFGDAVGGWTDVVEGADAVVHLVARTHVTGEGSKAIPEYRRTNVDVTRAVLRAAIEAGVPRFVYTSSIKAVGEGGPEPYDETTPCRPRDAYGVTKREAELLVHGETWGTPTSSVVVRPPLIYGPGVRGNFARLIASVERGVPLPLGRIDARRSLVHVDNVADALASVLTHPYAAGRTFHVADDGPAPTVRELVERIGHGLGTRPRLLPVPRTMLRVAGALLRRGGEVNRLTGSLLVATHEIRTRLGWSAPVDAEVGLQQTIARHRTPALPARAA